MWLQRFRAAGNLEALIGQLRSEVCVLTHYLRHHEHTAPRTRLQNAYSHRVGNVNVSQNDRSDDGDIMMNNEVIPLLDQDD